MHHDIECKKNKKCSLFLNHFIQNKPSGGYYIPEFNMTKHVVVIGAGPAGLETSANLAKLGFSVTLVEKEDVTGGHLKKWHALFPSFMSGQEVLAAIKKELSTTVKIQTATKVTAVEAVNEYFTVSGHNGWQEKSDAIVFTTGFQLFNARRKEEYGYGIYENVITSADLEEMFASGKEFVNRQGKKPDRVGFVHCVGSRDEKVNNLHCSKVCCITAVKQAIEVKKILPDTEVFCFYMDLRMFGRHYEELYKEAQEKYNIQFIRGRLSESTEDKLGNIVVKVEDTLLGKPLRINVGLLVLMVGMEPQADNALLANMLNLKNVSDGFIQPVEEVLHSNHTEIPGVFIAGACTGPKSVADTIADARSAALSIAEYLKS
jgi:heterodisulfide reductase subunit A